MQRTSTPGSEQVTGREARGLALIRIRHKPHAWGIRNWSGHRPLTSRWVWAVRQVTIRRVLENLSERVIGALTVTTTKRRLHNVRERQPASFHLTKKYLRLIPCGNSNRTTERRDDILPQANPFSHRWQASRQQRIPWPYVTASAKVTTNAQRRVGAIAQQASLSEGWCWVRALWMACVIPSVIPKMYSSVLFNAKPLPWACCWSQARWNLDSAFPLPEWLVATVQGLF